MSTKYEMTVSVTPLCSCCGKELEVGNTASKPTGHPFDRDNPYERKDRRVFIMACQDCFVFKGSIEPDFKVKSAPAQEVGDEG